VTHTISPDQLEFFNEPRARRMDPDTSHAAAGSVEAWVTEDRILRTFAIHGQLTDDELCEWLPLWHPPTVKTARSRLSKRGLLVDSGERRPSQRGRDMIVWRRP
jgi:hypothetical protein